MTPEEMTNRLIKLEKNVRRSKNDDNQTKIPGNYVISGTEKTD